MTSANMTRASITIYSRTESEAVGEALPQLADFLGVTIGHLREHYFIEVVARHSGGAIWEVDVEAIQSPTMYPPDVEQDRNVVKKWGE